MPKTRPLSRITGLPRSVNLSGGIQQGISLWNRRAAQSGKAGWEQDDAEFDTIFILWSRCGSAGDVRGL
jgi:hypothetical protein